MAANLRLAMSSGLDVLSHALEYFIDVREWQAVQTAPDHLLIRRSLEKPLFKEKMRLRSYGLAGPDDPIF